MNIQFAETTGEVALLFGSPGLALEKQYQMFVERSPNSVDGSRRIARAIGIDVHCGSDASVLDGERPVSQQKCLVDVMRNEQNRWSVRAP